MPVAASDSSYDAYLEIHCSLGPLLPGACDAKSRKRLRAALDFAAQAHRGQSRRSGEPYVSHPYAVAQLVRELGMDAETICAALLHDVYEDCEVGIEELGDRFGGGVASTVESLSKLGGIADKRHRDADAMRRMVMATSEDPRVAVVKLCDRLHNTRTLEHLPPGKARRIVEDTRNLHAPLARRLGLYEIYTELLDNCLRIRHPWRYRVLSEAIDRHRQKSETAVSGMLGAMLEALRQRGLEARIHPAPLTVAGVLRRLRTLSSNYRGSLAQVLRGGRFVVLLPDEADLYAALGALHSTFVPVPGSFVDYVAQPKANGYQSLHTRLLKESPPSCEILVLLRNRSMDQVARRGLLAQTGEERVQRMHGLFEAAADPSLDTLDFPEEVRRELQPSRMVVYTQEGGIVRLPRGATGLDFAYAQSDDQGNRALGVVVDGAERPLGALLREGAWVGLRLADKPQVSSAWLGMVTTSRARRKVNEYLQSAGAEQLRHLGEQELRTRLAATGVDLAAIPGENWDRLLEREGLKDRETAYERLSENPALLDDWVGLLAPQIRRLRASSFLPWLKRVPLVLPSEVDAELPSCCRAVGGDTVRLSPSQEGTGRLVAHLPGCPWQKPAGGKAGAQLWRQLPMLPGKLYRAAVHLSLSDHGKGTLRMALEAFEEMDLDITSFQDLRQLGRTDFLVEFEVPGRVELARIIKRLRAWPRVRRVQRYQQPLSRGA